MLDDNARDDNPHLDTAQDEDEDEDGAEAGWSCMRLVMECLIGCVRRFRSGDSGVNLLSRFGGARRRGFGKPALLRHPNNSLEGRFDS